MAMLAEPKNRQKYSVNPRGLDWVNDEAKFGQKLMEKMGWKKGKGLGANEDGNVDHVRVSLKTDNRGVGCTKQTADNWIAHQDDFASILADLNTTHTSQADLTSNSGREPGRHEDLISLEHKSKNSKSRVHYQKFTKGKDLSLKGKKDLDCIFGKRGHVKQSNDNYTKISSNLSKSETKSASDNNFGVKTVTSTTSVADYFAQKMAALKRIKSEGQVDVMTEQRPSFKTNSDDDEVEQVFFNGEIQQSDIDDSSECNVVKWSIGEEFEETKGLVNSSGKIKKSKRKRNCPQNHEEEISSPPAKPKKVESNPLEIETEPRQDIVSNGCEVKKKKKKRRVVENLVDVAVKSIESTVENSSCKTAKKRKDKHQ